MHRDIEHNRRTDGEIVQRILNGELVWLERTNKTLRHFAADAAFLPIASAGLGLLLAYGLEWMFNIRWPFVPCIVIGFYSGIKDVLQQWENVGEQSVDFDAARKLLIVKSRYPHKPHHPLERIPCSDLLLLRYWQPDTDNDSPGFILRLQISKNVFSPDMAGYLLHQEFVKTDAKAAEASSARIVEQLVAVTGIEYFDVQQSTDPRFKVWVNHQLVEARESQGI